MSTLLVSSFSSLALVLAGLLGALWLVRRFGTHRSPRGQRPTLAVESRLALGRNQGLALVRCGERTLLVSYGEGGVRRIEDEPVSRGEEVAASVAPQPVPAADPTVVRPARGARSITFPLGRRARTLLGLVFVSLAAVGLCAGPALAQAGPVPPPPSTSAPIGPSSGFAPTGSQSGFAPALSQLPPLSVQLGAEGDGFKLDGTVGTVVLLGLLSIAPTLLLLTTSFTRILVVLHFLRQALGTQNTPPGHLLAALALLLTGVVMAPTLAEINATAIEPWTQGVIDEGGMMQAAAIPLRGFMLDHTRPEDLQTFIELGVGPAPLTEADISHVTLMSAFALSELRAAFEIGFALFLPFVVIDLVVAAVLTSMGMFMLPPTMIALPCKLMLFVLMDGWSLVVSSVVQSFV